MLLSVRVGLLRFDPTTDFDDVDDNAAAAADDDDDDDDDGATNESDDSPASPCSFDFWRARMSCRRVFNDDRGRPVATATAVLCAATAGAGTGVGSCIARMG